MIEALPCTAILWVATISFLLYLLYLNRSLLQTENWENSANPQHILQSPSSPPPPVHPPSPHHSPDSTSGGGRRLREACSKAKDAGRHPSYIPLCLSLVHHYRLDVNSPVLSNGLTIFLCSCLSGSPDLVSSLLPLADLDQTTDHGETALYLAVYAAAHRSEAEAEVAVVLLLLESGAEVNTPNLGGVTALQQTSRKGCLGLARLLLDWGAQPGVKEVARFSQTMRPGENDFSVVGQSKGHNLTSGTKGRQGRKAQNGGLNWTMKTRSTHLDSSMITRTTNLDSSMMTRARSRNLPRLPGPKGRLW